MSSSYSASASLTVQSNAPAVLAQIARGLGMVDARIKRTERELAGLLSTFSGLSRAQASVTALSATMQGLQASTRGVARAMVATGQGADIASTALVRTTQTMTQAATAATQVATAAGRASAALRGLGAVRPMGGGVGHGAGARESRLGEAVAAGGLGRTLMGGLGIAGSLQHEQAVLRAQTGPNDARFRERVMQRAIEMTGLIRGTTVQGNYALVNELRTVLGGQEEALHFAPKFGEIAAALQALTGRSADNVVGGLGRAMTLRGSFVNPRTGEFDAERGMRETEMAGRMLMAFRDRRMDPQAMLMYQQQARVAGARLTPDQYFGGFVASGVQAMGGARFGTGHAAFYRQMGTGIMTNAQAEQMRRFGLLAPNAQGTRVPETEIARMEASGTLDAETAAAMRQGGASRFSRRHIVGNDLATTNPEAWRQFVQPIIDRAIEQMLGRPATQQDRIGSAAAIGATEVSRGWLQWLFNPAERAPDIAAVQGVQPGAARQLLDESFNVAMTNFTSGFTNMVTAIGQASTPDMIGALNRLATGFNGMAAWARENPETARIVGDLAAALAALAIGGAAFAAGTLALGGMTGLTTALGGLGAAAVTAGVAFIASPLGLALLGASIVGLAANLEGKDWAALLGGVDRFFTGFWQRAARYFGVAPGTAESGTMPEIGRDGMPTGQRVPVPPRALGMPGLPPGFGGPGFSDPSGSGFMLQGFNPNPPAMNLQAVPVHINLDGRRVGEGVLQFLERALSGPTASAARFDTRRALPALDQGFA